MVVPAREVIVEEPRDVVIAKQPLGGEVRRTEIFADLLPELVANEGRYRRSEPNLAASSDLYREHPVRDSPQDRFRLASAHFDRIRQAIQRSEEHTSELQSRENLVCRLLL